MHVVDALAIVLLAAAATAFFLGERALARADDVAALYWLAVGVVTVRAATRIARPDQRA